MGIPSASCSRVETLVLKLFPSQLLIQFGDIVVPLCLITGSRHWCAQVVFLPEALDLELTTAVSRAVSEGGLRAGQVTWLLIHQPHVPVKTWVGTEKFTLHVNVAVWEMLVTKHV